MTYDKNDIVCRRMHTVVAIRDTRLFWHGRAQNLGLFRSPDHLTTMILADSNQWLCTIETSVDSNHETSGHLDISTTQKGGSHLFASSQMVCMEVIGLHGNGLGQLPLTFILSGCLYNYIYNSI